MGTDPTCPACNAAADVSGETLLRNGQTARDFILESGRMDTADTAMPWVWGAAPAADSELLALYGVGRRVSAAAATVAATAAAAPRSDPSGAAGFSPSGPAAPLAIASPGQPTPGKLAGGPSLVSAGSRASMSSDGIADEGLGPDYLTRGGAWVPPRKEVAVARKRGRVFARGEAPYCCTSLRELEPLGVGTSGFFRLLCALTLIFTAMLAASAPAFVLYAAGRRVPLRLPDPIGFARISLGNIGPVTEDEVTAQKDSLWLAAEQAAVNATGAAANSTAVAAAAAAGALGLASSAIASDDLPPGYMAWLGSLTFLNIEIGIGPLLGRTLTLSGNVAAWVVTGSDAAVMLIVAIAFLVLRARLVSGAARASATRVSLADYSVMVRGLPRDVGAGEVRDHFSRLFALDGSGCDAYGNPPPQGRSSAHPALTGAAAAAASHQPSGDTVLVVGGGAGDGIGTIRSIRLAAASTRFALSAAAGVPAAAAAGAGATWATSARRQSSRRRDGGGGADAAAAAAGAGSPDPMSPAGAAGPASPSAVASSYTAVPGGLRSPSAGGAAAPLPAPLPKKALVALKKKLLRRARAGILTAADGNVGELTDRLSASICYARVASVEHLLPPAPPGSPSGSLGSPGMPGAAMSAPASGWGSAGPATVAAASGGDPSANFSLASPSPSGGRPALISPSAAATAANAAAAVAIAAAVAATPVPGRFGAPRTVRLTEGGTGGPALQITVVPAAGASPLDYTRDVPGPLTPARSPARSPVRPSLPASSPHAAATLAATATAASLGGLTLSPAAYAAALESAAGFLGSWVADVHLVMDDRAELAAYLARQSLLAQLRTARAEVKMYSAGTALRSGPDPARRMRALRRAEKLEFKLAGVRATIEAARLKRVQAAEAAAAARAAKAGGAGKGGATGFGRGKLSPAAGTASASVSVSVDVGADGGARSDDEGSGSDGLQGGEPSLGLGFITFNNEESAVRCVRAYAASAHVPGCLRRLVQDRSLHFTRQRDIGFQATYDAETAAMQAAAVWRSKPGGPGPPPEGSAAAARITGGTAAVGAPATASAAHIHDWAGGAAGAAGAAGSPDLPGMPTPTAPAAPIAPASAPAASAPSPPADRASARAAAKVAKAVAKWEKADKAAADKWLRQRRKERPTVPTFALHVAAAPDASNVVHENLGVSSTSRCLRVAATTFVGLLLLAAAFAAMVAGKVYGQRLSASLPDFGLCGSEIPALYFGGYENASAARLAVAAGYGGIVVDTNAAVVRGGTNSTGLTSSATALTSVEDGLPLLSLSRSPDSGSRRLEDNSCAVGSISLAYRYDFRGAMPLNGAGLPAPGTAPDADAASTALTGLPVTRVPIINGTLQLATPTGWALAAAYNPSSVQHLGTAVPYAGMADACDATSTQAYIAALPAAVRALGGATLSPACPDPRRRPPQPSISAAGATGTNPALTPPSGSGFCQCVVPDDTASLCPTLPCFQPSLVSRFRTCRTFPAATLAGCFCLYTLQQYIALQGPAAGFLAFSTGQRDVCGAFADAYAAAQAVILGTAAGAAVVNMLLGFVIPLLVAAERHVSVSAQSQALVVKVAAAQAVNTLLTAVVVNAGFGDRVPAVLAKIGLFGGGFDDMTTAWYASVGSSICLTLAIGALLAPLLPLLEPLFACLARCRMRHADGTARTQAQMDALFVGQPFDAGRRYPAVLLQLFGALVFGAAMPVLYGVAAVSFALTFMVDRWLVFRFAARPPVLDASLIRYTVSLLPVGLLLHATVALWAFTAGGLLPLTPLSAATGADSDIANQLALLSSAASGSDPFSFVQRVARLETLPQAAMLALVLGLGAIRILLVGGVSTALAVLRVLTCGCICCRGGCTRKRSSSAGGAAAGGAGDVKGSGLALPAISGRELPFSGTSARDVPPATAATAAGQPGTIVITAGGATAAGGGITIIGGSVAAPAASSARAPAPASSAADSLLPSGALPIYLLYPHAAGLRVISLVRGAVLLALRRLAPVARALYLETAALRLLRRAGLIGPASAAGVPSLEGSRSGQGKGLAPFTAPFSRFQDARALGSSGGAPRLSKLNVAQGWRISKLSANCFADALAGEARGEQERLAASGVTQREVLSLLAGRIYKPGKAGKAAAAGKGGKRDRSGPSRRGLPPAAGEGDAAAAAAAGGAGASAARSASKRAGRSKSAKGRGKSSGGGGCCCSGGAATNASTPGAGPGRSATRGRARSGSGGGVEMAPSSGAAGAESRSGGEVEEGRSRSGSDASHGSGGSGRSSDEGSGSDGEWEGSDGSGSGSDDGEWEGSDGGSDAGSDNSSQDGDGDGEAARTRTHDSAGGAPATGAAKADAGSAATPAAAPEPTVIAPVGQPYPLPEDDDELQSARLGGVVWLLRKLREDEVPVPGTPGLDTPAAAAGTTPILREMLTWQVVAEQGLLRYDHMVNPVYKAAVEAALEAAEGE